MKVRRGFVSNSSSSSFMVMLRHLTTEQVRQIVEHVAEAERINKDLGAKRVKDDSGWDEWETDLDEEPPFMFIEEWGIELGDDRIIGWTHMDNFDFDAFLRHIGVDMDKVSWAHEYEPRFELPSPEEMLAETGDDDA